MKTKILIASLLFTSLANAGDRGNSQPSGTISASSSNASAQAGAVGLGIGGAGGSVGDVSGGNVSVKSGDYSDLRIVPPAIAPSVGNNVICPMVVQGSKAVSVFFLSASGTHEPDIVPICVAWNLGQKDVVERMACNSSKEYAKANPSCDKK